MQVINARSISENGPDRPKGGNQDGNGESMCVCVCVCGASHIPGICNLIFVGPKTRGPPPTIMATSFFCFSVVTSFETLLLLDIAENLEVHAENRRVGRYVADDGNGALEQGRESGLCEPCVGW